MRILFFLPYPLHQAPSQRFRVEAYFELLEKNNIDYDTHLFLDENSWKVLYKGGSGFQKSWAVLRGFFRRLLKVLFDSRRYDYVFVHREASPIGPPLFEWLLTKVFRKKVIFDFDDAIWIPNVSEHNKLARYIKAFWKVKYIARWSYKISAGNAFLATWASQNNRHVVVNPTCVDMQARFNRIKCTPADGKVVIGWTGSHSTLKYLDVLYPVLKELEKKYDFDFLVICNQPPDFSLRTLKYKKWQEATEIDDLLQIDIGVMPLLADAWSEGKCGFKIIQYLALGIPAVASPVGVNNQIVEQGHNGFLCSTEAQWLEALETLLRNPLLRVGMGRNGKLKMEDAYSVHANAPTFLSLFSD